MASESESESEHAGMTPRGEWEQTDVHQASRYFCQFCGEQFAMPQDIYDHIDAEHPKPKRKKKPDGR